MKRVVLTILITLQAVLAFSQKTVNTAQQARQIQLVINFAPLPDKTVGDAPFNLVATSNDASTPITFASSNPSVVSVSNATGVWKATIVSAGSANITASQVGKANYTNAVNVVQTQVVKPQMIQSVISFAALANKTVGDAPFKLVATSNNTSTPITFTSSNPAAVSVSNATGSWMATIVAAGTANITASQAGNTTYLAAANVTQVQTVQPQMIQSVISFAALPNKTVGDAPFKLVATSNNTSTPITFSSSNPAVVSVSNFTGSWMATVVAAGTANITASQTGNTTYLAAANVSQAQIVQAAQTIPTVPGYITIPATIEAESYSAMSGIQTETTTDAGGGLDVGWIDNNDWMDYLINVPVAGTYTFNLRLANPSSGGKIELRSANGTVLNSLAVPVTGGWQNWTTVSINAGLPAGNQTLRIYAVAGGWNINKFEIATGRQLTSSINFPNLPVRTFGDAPFTLTATSNNTEAPITFTSSNPSVVSVSNATGLWVATINSTGTANITATQMSSTNYLAATPVMQTQTVISATYLQSLTKIPMNGKNWYQLNNSGDGVGLKQGLQELNDGILNVDPFNGWGKLLSNYNCWYDFKKLKNVTISRIRIFAGDKSSAGQPFNLYARQSFHDSILLASYDGTQANMNWIDIVLPAPVSANYLMANVYWNFPNEIELYGSYTADSSATLFAKKDIRFKDQLGVNEAIWDLTQGTSDPNIKDTLDPIRLKLAKSFTQVRDYVEWDKIETVQGNFVFQNTFSGGWNYDNMYKGLKANNIEILPCLKNIPNWFLNAYYPSSLQDAENVPAPYGSNLLDPNSYILQAKFAFQFVARYGSTQVDTSLLKGVMTGHINPNDPTSLVRTKQSGMGLIKYVECENERDKWWKGRTAYQTGFEYAANLSAFYDGNKNTMGAGVGVKNADPNIKVVIGGIASTSTDYVRAIIDWCKENRGYNADGSINLCFDVINYHSYANNAGTSQGGQSTSGAAPEVGGSGVFADGFAAISREYNIEAWVTETGYDLNQGSSIHAFPIGSKTPEQVEADWTVRTALLGARGYINRTFFYQMFDYAPSSGQMFASSGLLWDQQYNGGVWARKRAADYVMQTKNLMGNYIYKETLSTDPTVDRFQLNDTSIYALSIPDQTGRTANYTLNVGSATSVTLCTLMAGTDSVQTQKVPVINGQLQVAVSETPVFVKVTGTTTTSARTMVLDTANKENIANATIKLFPNPTTDYLNLQLKNEKLQNVSLRIFEAASGKVFKTFKADGTSPYIYKQIDVKSLPSGMFILQITKGVETITRKFLKM